MPVFGAPWISSTLSLREVHLFGTFSHYKCPNLLNFSFCFESTLRHSRYLASSPTMKSPLLLLSSMLLKKSARLWGRGTDSKRCEKSASLAAADLFVFMHGDGCTAIPYHALIIITLPFINWLY